MWGQALARYLRGGHVLGRTLVLADIYEATRAQYMYASIATGLLTALSKTARTKEDLLDELDVRRPELLDALLDLGVSWRELRVKNGRYSIRGRRSRAIVSDVGDPFMAHVQESTWYSGSVYVELAARMRGAPPGNYLDQSGELVARSSRVAEAPTAAFLDRVLKSVRPRTMVDVGCGSGVYLRQAATTLHDLSGVGIDSSSDAARLARNNVQRWHLEDRIRIVFGDVRDPSLQIPGPSELVTLFHNLYYFEPDERSPLLRRLAQLTGESGALAIVSLFKARTRVASHFEVVFRSTMGNTPLPDLGETISLLKSNGLRADRPKRLVPFESLYGIVARPIAR
jgi:4-hydroxy-2,2'-bipyrrole-5-carbaldehyde O-methyltransferase